MTQLRPSTPLLFCFGLGFSAKATARAWIAQGGRVAATMRSPKPMPDGVEALPFDPADARTLQLLQEADAILSSVPPAGDGGDADGPLDPVLAKFGDALGSLKPRWVGYLSTTGVYGDVQGAWVDENSPLQPISARSRNRQAAEEAWLSLPLPVHVFRLSGIYGPGRGPLAQVKSGTARRTIKPGHVMNRIHVEDIAGAVLASFERPSPGAVYNMADNEPAEPATVIEYAAKLLGVEPPPAQVFDPAAMTPMAASFWAEQKRVSNRKLTEELGYRLKYPTYREGLAAEL
ncbi:SDR family oxidoreductase [Lacibacterium aquatile]|uniref:SDR family oxidoreductase n=1 Tax=Lacibacterium aquatile TaxID=1168082 RepID=A0ABW5DPR7_9PROT